jgi:hypothetical protein
LRLEHQVYRRRRVDPAPWFLDGPGSGAPEWPETGDGEVDDGSDKERMMLHRLPKIEITGRDGSAVCQCRAADGARPPDAREEIERGEERRGEEEIERGEAGGDSG